MTKFITVNERGALTLPKEAREKLGVTRGGQLLVDMDDSGQVTLRAGVMVPLEMYSEARVKEFEEMNEAPLADKNSAGKRPHVWPDDSRGKIVTVQMLMAELADRGLISG